MDYLLLISELFYKILGYRKNGTILESVYQDKEILTGSSKFEIKKIPIDLSKFKTQIQDWIDNSPTPEVVQGKTNGCGCATLCALVQDRLAMKYRDKDLTIDWKFAWEDMIKKGYASRKLGSYLSANIAYFQKYGYKIASGIFAGKKAKCIGMENIKKSEIVKYIRHGFQIYTGSLVAFPYLDKLFHLLIPKIGGGHCWRIIGLKKVLEYLELLCETTWKNFGLKKESQFFLFLENISLIFKCYVIDATID